MSFWKYFIYLCILVNMLFKNCDISANSRSVCDFVSIIEDVGMFCSIIFNTISSFLNYQCVLG